MNADGPQHDHRLRWLPSIGVCLWLVFFLALTLSPKRVTLISADGDPCLHWRIGNWMIEHRMVIHTDQFSHTRFGAPLVSKEWLGEVLFALAGNWLGWNGAVLLAAALIATTMCLLHRQLVAEGTGVVLSAALVMAAASACSIHWLARPHLITHLLTVVFAWKLRDYHRNAETRRGLFCLLIPLMILWTNAHGAFFIGFVLIGIYLAGAAIQTVLTDSNGRALTRGKTMDFAALLGVCLLASLINPNGWKLHEQVIGFLCAPTLSSLTSEFHSPNFHSASIDGFLIELVILGFVLLVIRPRFQPVEILLIGAWGYCALRSARNIPVFALVVTPVLAPYLNVWLSQLPENIWTKFYRKLSADVSGLDRLSDGRLLAGLLAGALLAVIAVPRMTGSRPVIATEIPTNQFPVAAVQFLNTDAARGAIHGEMFNSYGWGGYLMLVLPERKVFIDGRNDFYGEQLVNEFNQPDEVKPGWEDVFTKYHVGWTILPPAHPLSNLLALRADWKQVYRDDVAVIYAQQPGLPPTSTP